ncbi:synaptonemal complex protein 1-like [Sitodiplosis mosellana]|uniref:synaptonemal complex protein 1-like n=1 Tax=Sitodiplosis mosellana TaxID=263140 RepID=UPI002445377D|nr:synaptonemal complex protein 1-like [Sitodiplosis mosellana]
MFKKRSIASLVANVRANSIFRRSKSQNKNYLKNPEWDVQPADNIIMVKAWNDRENAEVVEQHEKMREEAIVKGKQNKKRTEEARKMQKDLREKFIEVNDFINECEQKEMILDKKIAAEKEIHEKLQKEVDEYVEKTKKLTEYHEKTLKPNIEKGKVYEDVLQQLVDKMKIFKNKEDFLDRIEALLLAQKEVSENDEASLKSVEKMQADIVKISNEATLMIAGLENQLIEIEKNFDKIKSDYLKVENILHPSKEIIAEKEKEICMLLEQIHETYLLLCHRNNEEPTLKREQTEAQLDYIKREIEKILEVIELADEMMALETRSDIAEHGSGKSGIPRK